VIRFSLTLTQNANTPSFHVCRVQSENLSLGHHYRFYIHAWCTELVSPQLLLQQTVCLRYQYDIKTIYYHGVMVQCSVGSRLQCGWKYDITLVSPWYALTVTPHHRTWVNTSLTALITDLMQVYVATTVQYRVGAALQDIQYDTVCQYGERDYSFLQRLLYEAGFVSYFEQNETTVKLHFSSQWLHAKPEVIHDGSAANLLTFDHAIYRLAEHYHWGAGASYVTATVWMYNAAITLGDVIQIHNKRYRVFGIQLEGQQGDMLAADTGAYVIFKLSLWPLSILQPYCVLKQARYPYLFTGAVIRADWDEKQQQGIYQVCYHFDENQTLSVPVARAEWGDPACHVALLEGSKVVLACLEGSWSHVFIIGPLSSNERPTPVTQANALNAVKRQWDHEWVWYDSSQACSMRLGTAAQQLRLTNQLSTAGIVWQSDASGIALSMEDHLESRAGQSIMMHSQGHSQCNVHAGLVWEAVKERFVVKSGACLWLKASQYDWWVQDSVRFVTKNMLCRIKQGIELHSETTQRYEAKRLLIDTQQGFTATSHKRQTWDVGNTRLDFKQGMLLLKAHTVSFKAVEIIIVVNAQAQHH